MLLINTRPADRAAVLTHVLQQSDIDVFELSLLELVDQPYSAELRDLYQQLPEVHVIVVVSPTAVEVGMQYLQQSGIALTQLQTVEWIAVGQATDQALLKYGIQSHVPQVETSEGMLQLPVLEQLEAHATVAFWRGEGGRQFMMQQIQEQGATVLNFILYRRQCPAQAWLQRDKCVEAIALAQQSIVLISSEASWLNWLSLMRDIPHLVSRVEYWVLGTRLASVLQAYQQGEQCHLTWQVLQDLKPDTIKQSLIQGSV